MSELSKSSIQDLIEEVIEVARIDQTKLAADEEQPLNFAGFGLRETRQRITRSEALLKLEGGEGLLDRKLGQVGTGMYAYRAGSGQGVYLLEQPFFIGDLPQFYPTTGLKLLAKGNLRVYPALNQYEDMSGHLPVEITSFTDMITVTGEQTTTVTNPQFRPPADPPKATIFSRLFQSSREQNPQPQVPETIEKTVPSYGLLAHPLGGTAVRYVYTLPDARTFGGEPVSFSKPIDSIGGALALGDTPFYKMPNYSVTTILPSDLANRLYTATLERPEINREIGSRLARLCLGSLELMDELAIQHRKLVGRDIYSRLPDTFGMRVVRANPLGQAPYISGMSVVPVGSKTIR